MLKITRDNFLKTAQNNIRLARVFKTLGNTEKMKECIEDAAKMRKLAKQFDQPRGWKFAND